MEDPFSLSQSTAQVAQPVQGRDENAFQQWWSTDPKVVQWKKEFEKKYGEAPSQNDAGYDYRLARQTGALPDTRADDGSLHWPSKGTLIPRREPVWLKNPETHPTAWKERYEASTGQPAPATPEVAAQTLPGIIAPNPQQAVQDLLQWRR